MTWDNAVLLAYIAADAMNDKAVRKRLELLYGTFGIDNAWKGIEALASEWDFEVPKREDNIL